jgi:hypothetical protein
MGADRVRRAGAGWLPAPLRSPRTRALAIPVLVSACRGRSDPRTGPAPAKVSVESAPAGSLCLPVEPHRVQASLSSTGVAITQERLGLVAGLLYRSAPARRRGPGESKRSPITRAPFQFCGLVAAARASLVLEAIAAVDRLRAARAEGDLGLAAAARARCAEHLARAARIAAA